MDEQKINETLFDMEDAVESRVIDLSASERAQYFACMAEIRRRVEAGPVAGRVSNTQDEV